MRLRTLLAAAAVATATVLVPTAAQAAAPFDVQVRCDAATNTISVGTTGGSFLPNQPVTVQFETTGGSWSTGPAAGLVQRGPKVSVPATTGQFGALVVTGPSKAWPSANYVFYTETVKATVLNTQGQWLHERTRSCTYDLRTTVTVSCDGGRITAAAAGTRYDTERQLSVAYYSTRSFQSVAGGLRFTTGPNLVTRRDVVSSAGSWSDTGYTAQFPATSYYLSETVDVEVSALVNVNDWFIRVPVGKGTASCVHRGTP